MLPKIKNVLLSYEYTFHYFINILKFFSDLDSDNKNIDVTAKQFKKVLKLITEDID